MKNAVSHPRLVVLGILAGGPKHGYDIEEEVERGRMRVWAKVGMSSIYSALRALEREGCVSSRPAPSERGAGKFVYALTARGREQLLAEVNKALCSRKSVYSDRIAGLVFAAGIGGTGMRESLKTAAGGVKAALDGLDRERRAQARPRNAVAGIVLDYYRAVFDAERKALQQAHKLLAGRRQRDR